MRILILGGTSEASDLAARLAQQNAIQAILSLAGRTRQPVLPSIAHRIGGFGGVAGLVAWLRAENIAALVDATHPFARRMSFHVAEAAAACGLPILALRRPAWQPGPEDDWQEYDDHAGILAALGAAPRRVFLTVGRLEVPAYAAAPQHFYLVRSIDPVEPPPLPRAEWITARGPFSQAGETALLRQHGIDCVVSKNSGGSATEAKLLAARALHLPVLLLRRPAKPALPGVATAAAAMAWLQGLPHHG